MTNHNGEIEHVGKSGKKYVLKISFKGMKAVESVFGGMNFDAVADMADKGSRTHLEALIWSVFLKHHPEVTLEMVDDLCDDVGGFDIMTALVMRAADAAKPDPKDLQALGIKPTPPAAQVVKRTAGEKSTSKPDATV